MTKVQEEDSDKPLLTLIDIQRGNKAVELALKNGYVRSVVVNAVSWTDLAAIHLDHQRDQLAVERAILEKSLPARPWEDCTTDHGWLEWLDIESRNLVTRVAREFAYGFATEKKRAAAIRQISKLLSARNAMPPSSALGSDSAMPSAGASPSSASSSEESTPSKPTTA